ncbi:hypothetical protein [Streptomyces viridochromogenes]|uniref:hypothetical protein n=1 Tax=Streptomyces viridochromogenes TaxID=1938 RepID=UPI00069FA6F5|nr:hypothetical protein [Streptomyces viridochromogenes]KOG22113.1 hypothetical protein ADK36_12440 [Streptomyces viridochromogenes]
MAHTFEELVNLQRAADQAHARVEQLRDEYGPPTQDGGWTDEQTAAYDTAWRAWRDLARDVQAAVTEYAREQGTARNQAEADVKTAARHAPTD